MAQCSLPRLTILFGAGSTIAAGMPSVREITEHLEQLGEPGSKSATMAPFFKALKQILLGPGQFEDVNFELMLHALEVLEPLLHSGNPSPFPVPDYFRPVLRAFVELIRELKLTAPGDVVSFPYHRGGHHVEPIVQTPLFVCPAVTGAHKLQSDARKLRPCPACRFCLPALE
jgi:hypothetical protein